MNRPFSGTFIGLFCAKVGVRVMQARERTIGPKLEPHQVIMNPLVTEKGTHQSTRHNAYAFQVAVQASKTDIKTAVQEMFNVRVEHVTTQIRHGKKRRFKFKMGQMPDWKKAVVTLHPEDKIDFF